MLNKLNFKQTFATLILLAISIQMLPLSIFGQSLKNVRTSSAKLEEVQDDGPNIQPEPVLHAKIAPDLQESFDDLARGFKHDETQKVIIQLRPSTEINNFLGDEVPQDMKDQMFDEEVKANKSRGLSVQSKLQGLHGQFKKSFSRLGLVSAELPLSKVRELTEDEDVAYVSPDRETEAAGHLETTTGASLVRSLVSGQTVDGTGIGVAVLDSGIESNHGTMRSSTGASNLVYGGTFGVTPVAEDGFGHGSHVDYRRRQVGSL